MEIASKLHWIVLGILLGIFSVLVAVADPAADSWSRPFPIGGSGTQPRDGTRVVPTPPTAQEQVAPPVTRLAPRPGL
jgi:hypothetical protein